jgi:hypothetical protein
MMTTPLQQQEAAAVVINWDEAMQQVGDDEEFLRELLGDLRTELQTQIQTIAAIIQASTRTCMSHILLLQTCVVFFGWTHTAAFIATLLLPPARMPKNEHHRRREPHVNTHNNNM